ncbi:hypothetical protein [Psychroflexus salis]|uniref:hypothetical protein n=1 Tax=Psychroflexus salis TaxID=1526574 RepID=UPI001663AB0D|nr:hypothetical protein [Psychroflexus salis]
MIDKNKIREKSLYFEYGNKIVFNQYLANQVRFHEPYYNHFITFDKFKKHIHTFQWEGYSKFEELLNKIPITSNFAKYYNKNKFQEWLINSYMPKVRYSEMLLKKIKPKQIHFLCYYSDFNFALLASANRLNIKTVEMQHGPQTDLHLAYGNWSNLPIKGYDILPSEFWCWDQESGNIIKKWASNNNKNEVKIVGHPWINYWKEKQTSTNDKKYILYSLQPSPVRIEQLFTTAIINLIKSSEEEWLVRLHPRQMSEKKNIIKLLKDKGIYNKSNLEYATKEALPILLNKSKLNLTHFSGTSIEASLFGVKTILFNEIGLNSFPVLIKQDKAVYIDFKDKDFKKKINLVLEQINTSCVYTWGKAISYDQNLFPK